MNVCIDLSSFYHIITIFSDQQGVYEIKEIFCGDQN